MGNAARIFSHAEKVAVFSELSPVIACDPNTGCWLWAGTPGAYGYGAFRDRGKYHRAHRISHEVHNGPIPDGYLVMHKCDTPACVNPRHLSAGTYRDNIRDCISKGRAHHQRPWADDGSDGGKAGARLTPEQVREVRDRLAAGQRRNHISRVCGISEGHISAIRRGVHWGWLNPDKVEPESPLLPRATHNTFAILSALSGGSRMFVADIAELADVRSVRLYPILASLQQALLVESEMEREPVRELRRRKRSEYWITDAGRDYFKEHWPND